MANSKSRIGLETDPFATARQTVGALTMLVALLPNRQSVPQQIRCRKDELLDMTAGFHVDGHGFESGGDQLPFAPTRSA